MKKPKSSPFDLSGAADKPVNRFEALIRYARKHDAWLQAIIARDGSLPSCIEFAGSEKLFGTADTPLPPRKVTHDQVIAAVDAVRASRACACLKGNDHWAGCPNWDQCTR